MKKLLLAFFLLITSLASAQDVTLTSEGSSYYYVIVGADTVSQHSTLHKAIEKALQQTKTATGEKISVEQHYKLKVGYDYDRQKDSTEISGALLDSLTTNYNPKRGWITSFQSDADSVLLNYFVPENKVPARKVIPNGYVCDTLALSSTGTIELLIETYAADSSLIVGRHLEPKKKEGDMSQYFTDFSEYQTSDVPSEWSFRDTPYFDNNNSSFSINAAGNLAIQSGGHVLISYDPAGITPKQEVFAKFIVQDNSSSGLYPAVRINEPSFAANASIYYGNNDFRLSYADTDFHLINKNSSYLPTQAGDTVMIRMQAFGDTLRGKAWAQGDSEPANWALENTVSKFSTHTDGRVGLAIAGQKTIEVVAFGVGTGGDPAPTTAADTGTTVTLSGTSTSASSAIGDISKDSALQGISVTNTKGSGSIKATESISGATSDFVTSNANLESSKQLYAASENTITTSGNLTLAGQTLSLSGRSNNVISATGSVSVSKSLTGVSESVIRAYSSLFSLKNISAVSQNVFSGNANLTVFGTAIPLSGRSSNTITSYADLSENIGLKATDQNSSVAFGDMTMLVNLNGRSTTLMGGQLSIDEAKMLSATLLTTITGTANLTLAGEAWIGTLSVTHQPMYNIEVTHKPLHKINLQED